MKNKKTEIFWCIQCKKELTENEVPPHEEMDHDVDLEDPEAPWIVPAAGRSIRPSLADFQDSKRGDTSMTEKEATRTPGPWKINGVFGTLIETDRLIASTECGNQSVHNRYEANEINEANARFIVEAVNSHDSLTTALLEARREAERYRKALNKINSTNGLQYSDFFEICDQALSARRRGES